MAAIGDVERFSSPEKLVSYFGLNPRVRQSGDKPAYHGRITKQGRAHARSMLVEATWVISGVPGPLRAFFMRIRDKRVSTLPRSRLRASWRSSSGTC
ncbi:IS110 family transposase [Mesorhizobium sp. M1004]|uniref:IS110 family transposase n=1 Tax=Mesorhizobium sp. M1004 TaxID=2957046 RepID=UPI003334C5AA